MTGVLAYRQRPLRARGVGPWIGGADPEFFQLALPGSRKTTRPLLTRASATIKWPPLRLFLASYQAEQHNCRRCVRQPGSTTAEPAVTQGGDQVPCPAPPAVNLPASGPFFLVYSHLERRWCVSQMLATAPREVRADRYISSWMRSDRGERPATSPRHDIVAVPLRTRTTAFERPGAV